MPYVDARGHTVPLGTDQAGRQALVDLSLSLPTVRTCSSATAAGQHVAKLQAAGVTVSAAAPVLVWRSDLAALTVWDGVSWRQITQGQTLDRVNLHLSAGWVAVTGYTPKIRVVNGVAFLSGAVKRGPNAQIDNIGTVSASMRPAENWFLGAAIADNRNSGELHVGSNGVVAASRWYGDWNSSTGWTLPLHGSWPVG